VAKTAVSCDTYFVATFVEVFWSTLLTFFDMMLSHACRQFTCDILLAYNGRYRYVINQHTRGIVACLQLRRRGCRAEEQHRHRVFAAESVTSSVGRLSQAEEIPTVVSSRKLSEVNTGQLFGGRRDARVTAAKTVPRRSCISYDLVCSTRVQ